MKAANKKAKEKACPKCGGKDLIDGPLVHDAGYIDLYCLKCGHIFPKD